MLEILKFPDPRLNLKADPVVNFDNELKLTTEKMLATMYHYEGVGLAAIQVDIQQSITVIDVSEQGNEPLILINPQIIETSGSQTSDEGCLSFPSIRITVTRPEYLTVKAQDLNGNEFTLHAKEFLAKCIHHECEHLVGQVFIKDLSRLRQHLILKKLKKHQQQYAE